MRLKRFVLILERTKMAKKERADKILVDLGYFETKSKAQAAIMAGDVKFSGETVLKAGQFFVPDEKLEIEIKTLPYVSRGGFKLEKALKTFEINLSEKICLDAGASTGGFTDCMIQNDAKKIYAVDVGYGQLAWKLRNDKRVKVVERVNIKNCEFSEIYASDDDLPTFCAMDLSFISILKVLPNIKQLMKLDKNNEIVALIKPQFEAGKEFVGKNGVVRDKSVHINLIENIVSQCASISLFAEKLTFSPIKGPAGNIEYLILLKNVETEKAFNVKPVVDAAFENLE